MLTRLPGTQTVRTGGPVHSLGHIPGIGSIKARADSDETEDPGHEAGNLSDDQAPKDHDEIQEALGGAKDGAPDDLTHPRPPPPLRPPGRPYGEPYEVYIPRDQKDIETTEEHSNLLKKLTISRDRTAASNFEEERLLAIAANSGISTGNGILKTDIAGPVVSAAQLTGQDQQYYQYQRMLTQQRQQQQQRLIMERQQENKREERERWEAGVPTLPFSKSSRPSKSPETGFPPTMSLDMRQSPLHGNQSTPSIHSTEISARSQGDAGESELVSRLLRRIDDLERSARRSEHPPMQSFRPPRFQILFVLDDAKKTVCLQEPTWTFGEGDRLQLKAELPLVDLKTHLRKNSDISFLVYKSYTTPKSSAIELAESLETGVLPAPEPSDEFIAIMSEELHVALQTFIKSASLVDEEQLGLSQYRLQAPYLFWYRARLNGRTLSHQLPKYQAQLDLLFDWIERNYATKFDQFDEMISRGRISHAFTEYLFFPGDVVVNQDGDKTKAYQLQGTPTMRRHAGRVHHSQEFEKLSRASSKADESARASEPWTWKTSCSTIVYDGRFYRQKEELILKLIAESHDEEVDITELTVIPLQFVGKDLREQLMRRGRTFWSCRFKRPISYNGGDEDALHTDGERYVIDNKSYKRLHIDEQKSKRFPNPTLTSTGNDRTPLFVEEMDNDEPPQAPYIYLFPPTIPGFSLRRKLWTDLVVDKIVDVSWNKEAFKHLVADDKTKELVQALVADRISSERNTDIIQGKGNGLIILLHGGPGTGKTFTAESVAELAEKPLYPVTCGDIGTDPEQVERYLESVLYLGNLWDCVVLLDEADVFLEERGIADLARNALVSVFLRVLEYYDGILILTSNRVGTFDEAFKSRISLALHYPNFTKSQRCRIWKNFLNRLKALKEPDIDFDDIECNIQELASEELNGRQIRNAITIGRQLAKFQKKELSYAHLKHVVEVAGQFETYVKGTKENLSGEEIARAAGLR